MKHSVRLAAVGAVAALLLAACGDAPEGGADATTDPSTDPSSTSEETTAEETTAAEADFLACMVTDSGGIDDRSFNATAWKGLQDAETELGVEVKYVESNSETDFVPNVDTLVQDDCGIIVTVGFLLGDATQAAAEANADEKFAIVDFGYDEVIDNIKPLVFDTAQAAFLGGYVAAAMTETGTVATFGGIAIPSVTSFMDGFADGIDYHNAEKGTDVQLLGWDKAAQDGSFSGDFQNQQTGQNLAQTFIDSGADIIFPVAGPVGLGAAAAARAAGDVNLIWVDTDGYESAADFGDLFITSVIKKIDNAVLDATAAAVDGSFNGEAYVGTLENEGVGIAPFHDFEGALPDGLQDELDAITEQIISGEIVLEPAS